MIVQSAPADQPHFVITQIDHARASGTLAAAFGNEAFAALTPYEPMVYMVAHHDEGWAALDAAGLVDPETGLPYNLTKTPILKLIETGSGSPDHNERYHPYSGLISSMHTWGLYHGRYGLSDKIFIDSFPAEHRPAVDRMLTHEKARQERLTAQLQADPATAAWVEQDFVFHNYKLLQFFDTLALYFHTTHPAQRGVSTFKNVPCAVGDDVTLTITPLGDNVYQLSPFPFADAVAFTTRGRYLTAGQSDALFAEQTVRLVAL